MTRNKTTRNALPADKTGADVDAPLGQTAAEVVDARGELARLRAENADLQRRLKELQASSASQHQSHQAALSRMEDAVESRRHTETLNEELTALMAERHRAEAALRQSEQRFRAVANLVPDLLWSSEPDGYTSWYNHRWMDFTGQSLEEALGWGWTEAIHPDDRAKSAQTYRDSLEQRRPMQQKYRIRHVGGGYRWFLVRAEPIVDEAGHVVQWFGSATDIQDFESAERALRASQEKLRLVVDGAVEHAIITMDLDLRIRSWNVGAERIVGYAREEVIGQLAEVIMTPEDRANHVAEKEAAEALARGRAADERWHQRRDGSRFWASGVTLPMHEQAGAGVTGLIKIFRDETAKREAQDALEASRQELLVALRETDKARAEAEAATRAKDHFLAVLSHELRTPLMPVLMASATLARRHDLPEPLREALTMIRRNVQIEAQLVDDLLDVTRIVHGKMELLRADMDAHEVIARACDVTRSDVEERKQRLTLALRADQYHITGDAMRLQQVMWNLLKNASKFSPEGGEIRVGSYNEPGRLLIEVVDQGIGIEPEALTRIFGAFAQASVTITREFGGLGLGLSISKATVAAHGGTLEAQSEGLGKGARFVVSLPLPSEK